MDNITLLEYLRWADEAVFRIIRNVDGQTLIDEVTDRTGTLHDRILHLAEEYLIWLYDIQDKDHTNAIKHYSQASTHELMDTIKQLHEDWKKYVSLTEREEFVIKENENMAITVNMDEVIFNLVNHSSYHRGQIMTLLRAHDIDVPITDFYWYKISQQ